jgi:hypothetical protein
MGIPFVPLDKIERTEKKNRETSSRMSSSRRGKAGRGRPSQCSGVWEKCQHFIQIQLFAPAEEFSAQRIERQGAAGSGRAGTTQIRMLTTYFKVRPEGKIAIDRTCKRE